MDGNRFDDLTRALAATRSRRQVLKGLAATAVAAIAGPHAAGAALNKVMVCHHTGAADNPALLIEISANAVPAHQAHGDVINPDFDNDPFNCGGCSIVCDDGDPCTINACVAGNCAFPLVECPVCQVCAGGPCVPDTAQEGLVCGDDGDTCTDQVCRSGACATEIAVGRGCNDGDACTSGDVCQADGSCAGTSIVCPDDGNPCTDQVCRAGSCNSVVVAGRACDDGNSCTTGDVCQANGSCAGVPIICDDGEQCVNGNCQPICLELQAPCTAHNQCCNGLCQDVPGGCGGEGVPQCCVGSGVRCEETCDCCGTNSCVGGICCGNLQGLPCDEQRVCCDGFQCLGGTCQPATCLHTGDICNFDNNECCQDQVTNCEFSGDCGDFTFPRCCHPIGGTCASDCDCCAGAECRFGVCKDAFCREIPDLCDPQGLPCCGSAECRQGFLQVGVNQCCGLTGADCTNLGLLSSSLGQPECCIVHELTCGPSGTCEQCRRVGETCQAGVNGDQTTGQHNCCLGSACVNGVCAQPLGCQPSGGACQEDSVCCPGRACSNGRCVYVCSAEGEGCAFDDVQPNPLPCCGGLTCSGTFPNQRCVA
jgi:hypothetical protein